MIYTGYGNTEEQNMSDLLSPSSEATNSVEQSAQEVSIQKDNRNKILGNRNQIRKLSSMTSQFDPLRH